VKRKQILCRLERGLCLPKPAGRGKIQEITITAKPMKRKDRTAEKAAAVA